MGIWLGNAARIRDEALAEVLAPPPPVDFEAWAAANVVFTERESAMPGPYNPERFRPFSEILAALGPDDPCRVVTVSKGAQIGGTVIANLFLSGALDLDPGDFLYCHPTEENARRWSKLKLMPMIRASRRLSALFPEKSRDGGDSVLFKERFDGRGSLLISGANSPASLSQISMRRQVQDDLAKWAPNSAGDPETQADSRSSAFDFAKILKISTPLVLPGCRITRSFEAGSQEHYHVPCPHCGHMQTLDLENFLSNLDEESPEKTAFACIECGGVIEEHHRDVIVRKGVWIARNPNAARHHRSFHLWAAYSPLKTFEMIARAWLAARGSADAEKTFMNDVAGQPYRVKGEAPPWEDLRNRAETHGHERGVIPAPGLIVTVGIDVNGDWLNWHAVAWTRDHRRFVIDYGRIDGAISEDATHRQLDALLASQWRHASGGKIGADLVAIDGNAWTELVWEWARRHPMSKLVMVRGQDGDNIPLIARIARETSRRTGKKLKYRQRFYNIAVSILKWSLYRNLTKADPGAAGYVGFPKGLGDDYFKELTAEHRIETRSKSGVTGFAWIVQDGLRNEALDTMNQAEAAAIKYGVRDLPPSIWDRLERERARPVKQEQLDLEDLMAAPAVIAPPVEPPPPASPAPVRPRRTLADFAHSLRG